MTNKAIAYPPLKASFMIYPRERERELVAFKQQAVFKNTVIDMIHLG